MKERVKPSASVNQTCDAENAEKVKSAEFSSPLISGNFEEDMHVLQCVNNSGETGYREHENEQNANGISASDRPTNPMSPLLSLPLSKITATEPLNAAANGNALTDEIRTQTFTEFVPKIGSDIPAQSAALQVCCGTPEDGQRSPAASFGANSPVNWEQHIRYTFAFQRNNGAHCGHAVQQLLNFRDGPPLVNISEKKAKSENAEEKISRSRESKAETSPGELVQETFAGEINRKRRRRGEDEARKSALQRKMEHLDKEKERRLRQAKCYTVLRNLVPSCDMKTDKANVLEETVAYLNYIKDILGSRIVVIDKGFLEDFKRKAESLK